jgi:hypothetical protein
MSPDASLDQTDLPLVTSFRHRNVDMAQVGWTPTEIVEPLSIASHGAHTPARLPGTWCNQLIVGDAPDVLARLAADAQVVGHVAAVYFDPPYGARFVQAFNAVAHVIADVEMIEPFDRMWRDGNRSYVAEIRRVMVHCHGLLAPHGSMFVQTSDENGHRLRVCLDEVFGEDNFVATILIPSALHPSDALLPVRADYVHWYARDKSRLAARSLYQRRDDTGAIERLGTTWFAGADRTPVAAQRRVDTVASVIERCLLLTTEPGDLVLDPMVGSGTTPIAAEMHGRRWIGVEASRRTVAIASRRILQATFPAFLLADTPPTAPMPPEIDPRHGLVYRTAEGASGVVMLADAPQFLPAVSRVAGPFVILDGSAAPVQAVDTGINVRVFDALRQADLRGSGPVAAIPAGLAPSDDRPDALQRRGPFTYWVGRTDVVAVADDDVTVGPGPVRDLLQHLHDAPSVVIAAFRFHPRVAGDVRVRDVGAPRVRLLQLHGALARRAEGYATALGPSVAPFTEVLPPDVVVTRSETEWIVRLDPASTAAAERTQWLLDPHFDGHTLRVQRMLSQATPELHLPSVGRLAVKAIDARGRDTMSVFERPTPT